MEAIFEKLIEEKLEAVLNAQSKQYRKLTIYFYNNENGKRVKAAVPQKVKLIKDIEAFRSEHKFVRYI
uniref:Uncharacterized protein n=1 Tax=Romanomermis culicivorax TaxID=13658 RepID=A0A915JX92_ROMCU